MGQTGKKYFYETRAGTIKHAMLVRTTKAWFIFDNGDWIEKYRPLFETKEELVNVNNIVKAVYENTYCPEVVHIPNAIIH